MICSFCNREFSEAQRQKTCQNCSLFAGCSFVKCPYCGYETPDKPRIFKWLKQRKDKNNAKL